MDAMHQYAKVEVIDYDEAINSKTFVNAAAKTPRLHPRKKQTKPTVINVL